MDEPSRELVIGFCRKFFVARIKGEYTLDLLKNGFAVKLNVRPWRNEDDLDFENVVTFFIGENGSLDCKTYTNYYGGGAEDTGRPAEAKEMMEYITISGILAIMKP